MLSENGRECVTHRRGQVDPRALLAVEAIVRKTLTYPESTHTFLVTGKPRVTHESPRSFQRALARYLKEIQWLLKEICKSGFL